MRRLFERLPLPAKLLLVAIVPLALLQLVITAVVLEGRSKSEVARDYDVCRTWVQQLVRRYEAEGNAAFAPRSRRPHP